MADRIPQVLIYAPLADDAKVLAEEVGSVGFTPRCLSDDTEFASVMGDNAPEHMLFMVITQEGATLSAGKSLCDMHTSEPLWARLPVLFLVSDEQRMPPACQILADCDAAPSFIYFKRPVRRPLLRQTFRALSESRHHQFRTRDLMESLEKQKERNVFLLDELRHRVRNSLAVLQSLFKLTLRRSENLDDLDKDFGARLHSMSTAHSRLTDSYDQPADLVTILKEHVEPYSSTSGQLRYDGDPIKLPEQIAFELAMTVHELATNAAKYGALSTPAGRVDISWSLAKPSGNLDLLWRETGGPPVDPPSRHGLGSTLIENFSPGSATKSRIEFNKTGLVWRGQIPSEELRQ